MPVNAMRKEAGQERDRGGTPRDMLYNKEESIDQGKWRTTEVFIILDELLATP